MLEAVSGGRHVVVGVQTDLLVFDDAPEPLDEGVRRAKPLFPSMLILMSALFNALMKSMNVIGCPDLSS